MLRAGRTPRELAESLGVSQQTLRNWRPQDQLDRHERDDGLVSDEREELRRLRRENVRLKQERDLLKRAAAFFAAETETGDGLPDDLGGEGQRLPGLHGLRPARCEPRRTTSGNVARRRTAR
jgi:transposase